MSFKDFRVLETIGKGSFASVYKVSLIYDEKAPKSTTTMRNKCAPIFTHICAL